MEEIDRGMAAAFYIPPSGFCMDVVIRGGAEGSYLTAWWKHPAAESTEYGRNVCGSCTPRAPEAPLSGLSPGAERRASC